ncbi:recombination protein NinB [Aeromonas hydrophila]|uniref:recombination protein NinB n=1 Tax=Aeromonas hydrophila TaxID=644 RepID=UPI0023612747|nr:recombination protein NinB [Aeromonas hydrophila]
MPTITKDGIRLTSLNFTSVGKQISELLKIGDMRITVKPWREKRSLSQNALLHLWMDEISDFLIRHGRIQATPEWVKDAMKHSFLGYIETERINVITGERITVSELKHTSSLDTGEMHYFLSHVEVWAVNINCRLTIPDNCEYRKLKEIQND